MKTVTFVKIKVLTGRLAVGSKAAAEVKIPTALTVVIGWWATGTFAQNKFILMQA